ncbi:tRNA (5-methylaminomethyl-2-thiouridine)(34)-methyltransferase MnmD [Ascidiaceihabitans sp.]|uniref:tRNA (5-methylaminomethyl-2-thiouridine)(34)-methyltransferase MnmD n=1 Tax=Ascidiaceihabitans sp. TaxID=1872644 RepID=UPI00329933AA
MQDHRAELEWRDGGVPVSKHFDDPYFSLDNGLAETRHVFLEGNGISARLCDRLHIAELGFGTGLNLLTTVLAWQVSGAGKPLHFTSFEAFPMAQDDIAKALSSFPELHAIAPQFVKALQWDAPFEVVPGVTAHVIVGDARQTLPAWRGRADAWYLDGFSPAKNPELWSPELMSEVGRHTASNGTVATYTAAGFVRRGLEDAGFDVMRIKGFGRKRHMTVGTLVK